MGEDYWNGYCELFPGTSDSRNPDILLCLYYSMHVLKLSSRHSFDGNTGLVEDNIPDLQGNGGLNNLPFTIGNTYHLNSGPVRYMDRHCKFLKWQPCHFPVMA